MRAKQPHALLSSTEPWVRAAPRAWLARAYACRRTATAGAAGTAAMTSPTTVQKRALPPLTAPVFMNRNPYPAMRAMPVLGSISSSFSSARAVAASFGLARAAASRSACVRARAIGGRCVQ
jgi:hypothetical protein